MEVNWAEVRARIRRAEEELAAATAMAERCMWFTAAGSLRRAAAEIGHALVALNEQVEEGEVRDGH